MKKLCKLVKSSISPCKCKENFSEEYKTTILLHNYSEDLVVSSVGLKPEDWINLKLNPDSKILDKSLQKQYKQFTSLISRMAMAGIINSRQYSVREFTGNFEDAHKFNSLRELFKFARRSREYGTDKMKTRHIVFTYDSIQKCENGELKNSLKFQAIVMHNSLSYLEKKSLVTNTLNSSDNDAVTIHFPNLASWKYIENIKYIIDDLTSTNIYILQKVVVLVAHYSNSDLEKEVKETPSSSINFGDSTWSMHAIDNLSRSEPKRYFETMMMTPLQYIEAKSMSDQIFRNIVSSNFVDYLDNFPDLQEEENIDDYEKIIEVMQNNRALLQMLKNNLLRIIDTRQEACFQNSFYS
jgi:hypothetical protein